MSSAAFNVSRPLRILRYQHSPSIAAAAARPQVRSVLAPLWRGAAIGRSPNAAWQETCLASPNNDPPSMLHRCLNSLPWSDNKQGEPTELPNILREDLLMLIPVSPLVLLAMWHVSYSTQNRLFDMLGDAALNSCRLMLRLEAMHSAQTQDTEVSGPSRSRYINLCLSSPEPPSCLTVTGQLGYEDNQGVFYALTRARDTVIPRNAPSPDNPASPAINDLYERIFRRLELTDSADKSQRSNTWIAKRTDELLRRVPPTFGGH